MLRYGCTRLEIGVQSVYEDVARDTNRLVLIGSRRPRANGANSPDRCFLFFRGHTVKAVTESFHMAKDAGYKIVAHMMPVSQVWPFEGQRMTSC